MLDPSQFSVAGEARDLATLQARLDGGVAPDLVVADLNGSQESDLDNLRAIRANYEHMRIVVLANELCLAQMARLLKAGIDGYLLNELSAKAFSPSLLLVMTGRRRCRACWRACSEMPPAAQAVVPWTPRRST